MSVMLLIAGQVSPAPVPLVNCLRDIHAEVKASRAKEIAERKRNNAPLDESTRWNLVQDQCDRIRIATGSEDAALARESAVKVLELTSDAPLPIGDLELPDGCEDISLVFRALSEVERRRLAGNHANAWGAVKAARVSSDDNATRDALNTVTSARIAYVLAAVAEVRGIEGDPALDEAVLDALSRAGLLVAIFEAASWFQELSPKKAVRFGQPPASISPSSTAQSAHASVAMNGAAMAATYGPMAVAASSPVPSMNLTPAPSDTSSRTLT